MTTAFEPPEPGSGPKILADLLEAGGHGTPKKSASTKDGTQDNTTDADTTPDAAAKDEQHNSESATKNHPEHTDSPEPDDEPADDTYTSTEPGFPIGQLISGLISTGIGAATAGASAAMAIPTTAVTTLMPLLNSLLALLGNPSTTEGAPGAPALPDPVPPPDKFSGASADRYRDQADRETADEQPFADQDTNTDQIVNDAQATNAKASSAVTKSIDDLHTAAAMAPATGQAVFAASARDAISSARNAVNAAADHQQTLAARLASNR